MKVFISWSGQLSRQLAEAIRDWLPGVMQLAVPYFTPSDIEKGTRWATDIAKELESSQVGILCITRDNLHSDWILFEAGALSKSLDKAHVCPILFGITNTDLAGPLKQFQTTEFEKADFHKLIGVINSRLGDNKLSPKTLDAVFDKWWPDLEQRVKDVMDAVGPVGPQKPVRTDRELIEEILLLSRAGSRMSSRPPISAKAISDLLEAHIELHDNQVAELGGYQDVLDILQVASKPLEHIASRYLGSSERFDVQFKQFKGLTYQSDGTSAAEAADPDDPF